MSFLNKHFLFSICANCFMVYSILIFNVTDISGCAKLMINLQPGMDSLRSCKFAKQTLYKWPNVTIAVRLKPTPGQQSPHCLHTFSPAECCSPKASFLHAKLNPCGRTFNRHSCSGNKIQFFFILSHKNVYLPVAVRFLHDKKSHFTTHSCNTECIYLLSVWVKGDSWAAAVSG